MGPWTTAAEVGTSELATEASGGELWTASEAGGGELIAVGRAVSVIELAVSGAELVVAALFSANLDGAAMNDFESPHAAMSNRPATRRLM